MRADLIERLRRGRLLYVSASGPVYAGPTALEREAADALASQEPVGEAGPMPGTRDFTIAAFAAEDIPIGTKLYAKPVDGWRPVDQITDAELDAAWPHGQTKCYQLREFLSRLFTSPVAAKAEAEGWRPMPRGGIEPDWQKTSIEYYRRYRKLRKAAKAVIDEMAKIHDNDPWPLKYRAPFGAIADLSAVLDAHPDYVPAAPICEGEGQP